MAKDKSQSKDAKKDKKGQAEAEGAAPQEAGWDDKPKMKRKEYEPELEKLQIELVKSCRLKGARR